MNKICSRAILKLCSVDILNWCQTLGLFKKIKSWIFYCFCSNPGSIGYNKPPKKISSHLDDFLDCLQPFEILPRDGKNRPMLSVWLHLTWSFLYFSRPPLLFILNHDHPGSVAMKTYTTLLQPEAHPSYSCFLPALLPPFTRHSRNH